MKYTYTIQHGPGGIKENSVAADDHEHDEDKETLKLRSNDGNELGIFTEVHSWWREPSSK